jgi:hypothetical protein
MTNGHVVNAEPNDAAVARRLGSGLAIALLPTLLSATIRFP